MVDLFFVGLSILSNTHYNNYSSKYTQPLQSLKKNVFNCFLGVFDVMEIVHHTDLGHWLVFINKHEQNMISRFTTYQNN